MHGNGALALPFNDEDLDGADEIVFRVGASVYTATVPAPVATGGLPYGYYAYGSSTDDLGDAVAAALTAADPSETWSCERWTDGLVQKYTLRRTGTAACSLDWNNAGTTFTAEWLGYDSSGNDTGGVTLSDRFYRPPYAPGRVWFPPYTLWTRRDPERVTAHSLGYAGTVEKRRYSVGWKHLDLRHGPVVEARLFKSAVEDFDLNAAVDGLDTADPNFSLESLWDWAATRTPFRYTWDWESSPDDYYSLEVRDNEWLTRFSAPLSLLPDTSPPQWEVTLPMIDYKTTGSDFDLASVVCASDAIPVYDSIEEGLAAHADGEFFGVSYRESTDGRRPAGKFYTQRLGANKISILPVVIPPDAVGTVGGLWQPMSIGDSTSAMAFNGNGDLEQTYDDTIANDDTSAGGGVGRYLDERTGQNAYELGMYLALEVERPGNILFETENDGYPGVNTHYYYGYLKDQFQFLSVMANATGAAATLGTFAVSSVGTIGFTASGTGVPHTKWFSLQTQWRVVADADSAGSVGTDAVWRGTGATSAAISQSGTNATLSGWLRNTTAAVFYPFVATTVYNATPSTANGSVFRITGVGEIGYIGEPYP